MAHAVEQPDALVLGLTWGMSLRAWEESGMLTREWALYSLVLHHVPKLVIISYGNAGDHDVLARIAGAQAASVQLVCNDANLSSADYVASLPARIAPTLAGAANIVCKTNQLAGGDVLVRLAEQLRTLLPHATIATIARGGYLWSRFLAHEHGPDSKHAKDAETRERLLCQAADLVVGTTQDMVKDLTWRYTLDAARTTVIPNYVVETPRAQGERDANLVLYAGQLTPRKRVDMLIRACEIAAHSAPSLCLRVIGEGPSTEELKALAAELHVQAEFLPRMPHNQLMQQMDLCGVYAQASELEGHPKTVIEAMSRAAPVVVTDAPGMSDVVQHGVTGLRSPPSAEALGQAIAGLMMDADWANVLGQSARDCTLATLGLQAILPRELSAYRIAIARASSKQLLSSRTAV